MFSYLGFELPLRHYIGWFQGKPVACSLFLLNLGVAGIYLVATMPDARGHGFGSALTLEPLCDACNMGYRVGTLGLTEMGFGMYQRIGFREYLKLGINLCDYSNEMY